MNHFEIRETCSDVFASADGMATKKPLALPRLVQLANAYLALIARQREEVERG